MRRPDLPVERRAITWWMLRNLIACGTPTAALVTGAVNIRGPGHRTAMDAAARVAVVAELAEGDGT